MKKQILRWKFVFGFGFFHLFIALLITSIINTPNNTISSSSSSPIVIVLADEQAEGIPTHKLRSAATIPPASPTTTTTAGDAVASPWSLFGSHKQPQARPTSKTNEEYNSFVEWCQEHLGITGKVEIKTFYYHDSIRAMKHRIDVFSDDADVEEDDYYPFDDSDWYGDDEDRPSYKIPSMEDYPMIPVRGLAANQNIEIGDVVIDIPHDSLWTLQVIIDQDPVLSQVMGPDVRQQNQWLDGTMDEIPLLAVALLYHLEHIEESPYQPYLSFIADIDQYHSHHKKSIPHLWKDDQLRRDATSGVRRVAKGIQADVREMYQQIVVVLIKNHPDIFGKFIPDSSSEDEDEDEEEEDDDDHFKQQHQPPKEWLYSFQKFHWAFALVNSRHWHLPLPKLTTPSSAAATGTTESNSMEHDETMESDHTIDQAEPPAAMPTDEWLDRRNQESKLEEQVDNLQTKQEDSQVIIEEESLSSPESNDHAKSDDGSAVASSWLMGNSFLAPMADLLNFGPPCTRGVYNADTHSFQILATCKFLKGQEVTFWYADACQDVFMANYGFVHPAVPICPNVLKQQIVALEDDLDFALDRLDVELDRWWELLKDCDCAKAAFAALLELEKQMDADEHQALDGSGGKTNSNAVKAGSGAVTAATTDRGKTGSIPMATVQTPSAAPVTTTIDASARHAIRGEQQQASHTELRRRRTRASDKQRSRKSDL